MHINHYGNRMATNSNDHVTWDDVRLFYKKNKKFKWGKKSTLVIFFILIGVSFAHFAIQKTESNLILEQEPAKKFENIEIRKTTVYGKCDSIRILLQNVTWQGKMRFSDSIRKKCRIE